MASKTRETGGKGATRGTRQRSEQPRIMSRESRLSRSSRFSFNRSCGSTHSRYTAWCCRFRRRLGYGYRILYGSRRFPSEARNQLRQLWVSASPPRVLRIASGPERIPALCTIIQALLPRCEGPKKESQDHRSNQASDFAGWYNQPAALRPSPEEIQALTTCILFQASPHRCYANSAAARS